MLVFCAAGSHVTLGVMITLRLTDEEVENIAEAQDDPEVPERSKKKLLAITMHHKGIAHEMIGGVLRISPPTLATYLKDYRDGGLPRVLEDRFYRPLSSLEPFWQCLVCSFKAAPVASAKEAVARIEKMTGVRLSESQARRTMKKMGMALRKCAPVPGKADAQLQLEFFNEKLQPRLEQAARGERKVFFVDAAHFVLGPFLGMVWCFARPFLKTPSGRQRYNVLGAVDSHTKEFISVRTRENIDASSVCELLYQIRCAHPEGAITLVMDNARYQHCAFALKAAADYGIELLFLPPYSPNLNLIERLWKLVKKRCLTNRYYDAFAKFTAAIDRCLDSVNTTLKDEVGSLLTLNFQFFGNAKS